MFDEDNSCNWHGANTTADVVNAYCVHNRRLGALCPILVLFEYTVDRLTNERQSINDQVMNLKSMVCLLAKQRTILKWKVIISVFLVLQGSVETLIRWGGKICHLPIACFLQNFFEENFKHNFFILMKIVGLTTKKWDFDLNRFS